MLEYGFVKLHRSILKWEWYDEPNTMRLFIHLLLTVNASDEMWRGEEIPRGSRISSYSKLAKELHLTNRQIRTSISHLEETGELTRVAMPNYTVFTVVNYDLYQSKRQAKGQANDTQTDNRPTRHRQQSKKVKESIRSKEIGASATGAVTPEHPQREKSIYERMRE